MIYMLKYNSMTKDKVNFARVRRHQDHLFPDKLKPSEFFFLLAGLLILASLPSLTGPGLNFWIIAKICYFFGLVFFIFRK